MSDDILDDIVRIAQRCERAGSIFAREPIASLKKRLVDAASALATAWSGSWVGYQALIYKEDLRPARAGEVYDSEWGNVGYMSCRTQGEWAQFTSKEICDEIMHRARCSSLDDISNGALEVERVFEEARDELLPTLDAVLSATPDATLAELREKLNRLKSRISQSNFLEALRPQQIMSRDSLAIQQGLTVPPHIEFQTWLTEQLSCGEQARELGRIARRAAAYLEKKHKLKGKTVAKTTGKIFIGHGGSSAWRDLKDFLIERLGLEYEEFNRESAAGLSNKERLLNMLDSSCFAFLVMTAEDEHADGSKHARANVIHEAGLFQGRYGFERAIILLEEGCEEFSNVHGIGQIRFPKGNIEAKSEEIRQVLEREGIV